MIFCCTNDNCWAPLSTDRMEIFQRSRIVCRFHKFFGDHRFRTLGSKFSVGTETRLVPCMTQTLSRIDCNTSIVVFVVPSDRPVFMCERWCRPARWGRPARCGNLIQTDAIKRQSKINQPSSQAKNNTTPGGSLDFCSSIETASGQTTRCRSMCLLLEAAVTHSTEQLMVVFFFSIT